MSRYRMVVPEPNPFAIRISEVSQDVNYRFLNNELTKFEIFNNSIKMSHTTLIWLLDKYFISMGYVPDFFNAKEVRVIGHRILFDDSIQNGVIL